MLSCVNVSKTTYYMYELLHMIKLSKLLQTIQKLRSEEFFFLRFKTLATKFVLKKHDV